MGKVNRRSMPQSKSRSVSAPALTPAQEAQRALDKAKERQGRGMTGFTRPGRKSELKRVRNRGVQGGAASRSGESQLGRATRGRQY